MQANSYSLNLVHSYINLTSQLMETTSNRPVCMIQKTLHIPILINSSISSITFNQSSILKDINSHIIIGNFTMHNLTQIIKKLINIFPLINNQIQVQIQLASLNIVDGMIRISLNITHQTTIDSYLSSSGGNATRIYLNER